MLVNPAIGLNSNAHFKVFLAQDGMNIGFVTAIYKDYVGYMWFGGNQGLIRYEGHNFKKFAHNSEEPGSLSHNAVHDIAEDSQNRLWIATEGGLNLYSRHTEQFTEFKSLIEAQNYIWGLAVDKQDNLWLATVGGVVFFDTALKTYELIDDPRAVSATSSSEYAASSLHIDKSGVVWGASNGRGLLRIQPDTRKVQVFAHPDSSPNSEEKNVIWDLVEDDDGLLWLGSNGGLDVFSKFDQSFQAASVLLNKPDAILSRPISSLLIDQAGCIWSGTNSGVLVVDPNKKTLSHLMHDKQKPGALASNVTKSIYIDDKQDVWVGTFPQGVSYLNRSNLAFETFYDDPNDKNSVSSILSFDLDKSGHLLMGTDGGGVRVITPTKKGLKNANHEKTQRDIENRFAGRPVLDIEIDFDNSLWVATWGHGLYHYDSLNGSLDNYKMEKDGQFSLHINDIWSLFLDSNNDLWVATIGASLYRFNRENKNFKPYYHLEDNPGSISSLFVWSMFEDSRGDFWVGTSTGLDKLDRINNNFTRYQHRPGDVTSLSNAKVVVIKEALDGHLWLGTEGGGLNKFDPESGVVTRLGIQQGLSNLDVVSLEIDDFGNLWLGTRGGLFQYDVSSTTFRNYDIENGLQGNHFNIGSSFKYADGRILFGGTNGYTQVRPERLMLDELPPKVILTQLKVFNKGVRYGDDNGILENELNAQKEIVLDYHYSMLTLEFAALNYRNPEKNQYAYMLEGFDKEWNFIGNSNTATYTNLDAGKYVFNVKAADYSGEWPNRVKQLSIVVLPPWWASWWAYTFYIAVVLLAISYFFFSQYRKRSLIEEQNRILEQKVQSRTTELNDKHERLKNAQSEMLQMRNMASLGTLVAGVAHEINNPNNFTYVNAYNLQAELDGFKADLIEMAGEDVESDVVDEFHHRFLKFSEMIDTLIAGSTRIKDIVENLKAFSQAKQTEHKAVELVEAVRLVVAMLKPSYNTCVNFDMMLPDSLTLYGSPAELNQLIVNVLTNACQAIEKRVNLDLSQTPARGNVGILLRQELSNVKITISDDGAGMDDETLERLFEPFYTTKEVGGGAGLGLSIAYSIVEKHHGKINVESIKGRGSCFTIIFPESGTKTSVLN